MARENPNFWIAEGFRQLRLGLAWSRLAWLTRKLPHPLGVNATLGAWLNEKVVKEFLQPIWLPGVQDLIRKNAPKYEEAQAWTWPGPYLDRLEQMFMRAAQPSQDRAAKKVALSEAAKEIVPLFDACVEAARQSEEARPATVKLPNIHVPSPLIGEAWLVQARALEQWDRIAVHFARLAPPSSDLLESLSRECQQTSDVMQERHRFHSLLRFIPGQSAKTHQALDQAAAVLRQVSEKLAQFAGNAVDADERAHHAELSRWYEVAVREEERIPRHAAVRQLVEFHNRLAQDVDARQGAFLDDLIEFWEGRKRKPWTLPPSEVWTQGLKARAQIALWIVEYFDHNSAKERLPDTAWELLSPWLHGFLEGDLTACLVRRTNAWPETFDAVETDGLQIRAETTGLALTGPAQAVVLRKAKLSVPRRPHPLESALRHLGDRTVAVDPEVAGLCHDLAERVLRRARSPDGPLPPENDVLPLLWRLGQRVAALPLTYPQFSAAACAVLKELSNLGYSLTEVPQPPYAQQLAQGPWLLLASPNVDATTALPTAAPDGRAVALRLPDGRLLIPAVWLVVPQAREEQQPLVRCLREAEPLLAGLQYRFPEWSGWTDYNSAVWDLAHREPRDRRTPLEDAGTAKRLIQDLHRRTSAKDRAEANAFRELTRRLYRCLTEEMNVKLTPPLDPVSLDPAPLRARPDDGTQVELLPSDRPFGEVLLPIEEFGVPGSPGKLRVSGGPGFTRELMQWLKLPAPIFSGLDSDPRRVERHPLTRWHQAVQQAAWQPNRPADLIATHRTEFQTWLTSPAGKEWFHQWIIDVHRATDPETTLRQWHDALLRDRWFRCIPAKDHETVIWPRDVQLPMHLEFVCSPTVPAWRVMPGTEFFAATPELARATVSLGPRIPGGLLDKTYCLAERIAAIGISSDVLTGALRQMTRSAAESSLLQAPLLNIDRVVLTVLDGLVDAATTSAEKGDSSAVMSRLQDALDALRSWCQLQGLDITPAGFTFNGGLASDRHGETSSPGRPLFGAWGALGSERLLRFGLRRGLQVVRPYETGICAGPAPTNYLTIRQNLATCKDAKLTALVEALDAWPRKAIEGTLPYAIQDFYVRFWSAAGTKDPELVKRVEKELNTLLETDLQLAPFYPNSTLDFPDGGLEIRADGPIRTGDVRRVIRPGLRAMDGAVPVKAIVEAE